ncbi:phosphoglucosamine mutase [Ilumatobacter fluminis]|uniref:Phosphoglucosamine mutase n=1 Tax=Ilumatobacter fluminis TaxID=467091 RepID=A0A4R7I4D5_9ACTN|nr:phosphoglucosamine mutase [Ilumatobacter fluminis]TDT17819.1 phosphoglucosamine mutase [Ilumatobacter fluminis]
MRFGTDGVRGRANTDLTASFALDLGRAAAKVLRASVAVVGGDSRLSTPMLEAAFVAGLAAEGVEVHRLGVTPTPAVAFEAQRLGAMGAVISASHNPYHDNGIKLFAVGGTKLPDDVERAIEAQLVELDPPSGDPGLVHGRGGSADAYVEHLLRTLDGRDLTGMRVVVDAANGAASHLAADVFTRTGAQVVVINDRPDGRNINDRCGATDVDRLRAVVTAERAQVGIALDGDADRLIAVDEQGDVVDGDHVIAICAADLRARGLLRDDTVVVTVMTNLGFRLAMEAAGIAVVETPVGDRYVLEALNEHGYSLGGEQSGHVIFSDWATTGDGLLTALVLLDVVQRSGRRLSRLAREAMTQLPQVLVNIPVAERRPDIAAELADEIAAAQAELGETGRILVRASGTEPFVRVMVEAPTAEQARATADRLAAQVR